MSAPMQRLGAEIAPSGAVVGLLKPAQPASTRRQRVALVSAIESQIVPRLLAARAQATLAGPPVCDGMAPTQAVKDIAALALGADEEAVRYRLLEEAGHQTLESVCLNLLSPAARHLGDMWAEDLCSFAEVTIGMMRLHDGLHALAARLRTGWREGRSRHRILLAPGPGNQHTFGLAMVATFFEQAGWTVETTRQATFHDLSLRLRQTWFGVLGFSVSTDAHLEDLAALLPRLRDVSRNRALSIMVGGPIFAAHPELAAQVGADGTAADGVQATWMAENMLTARVPSH